MTETQQETAEPSAEPYKTPDTDPLAKEWGKRIASTRKHWDKYHKRVAHNRKLVAGFDWNKDPAKDDFYTLRANLIHGTITAILPNIYARNPAISVTPTRTNLNVKLLCQTLQTVLNRQLVDANLKKRGKSSVRAALTCSMGITKVTYQRDKQVDPIIKARISDTQDNLGRVQALLRDLDDPDARSEQETIQAELEQTIAGLEEQVEVVAAEGLVIDRVLSEHLLIDPAITEFWDYQDADFLIQLIPSKKKSAEEEYGIKLDKATTYRDATSMTVNREGGKVFSGGDQEGNGDALICIAEIWDRRSQRVYTMVEGCDYFLREPYSPGRVGSRWYPFFILPFQTVDGQFIGPSLVDLCERLQKEHNDARDKFNKHRELSRPGYLADKSIKQKDLVNFTDSVMGEVTLIESEGRRINEVIVPKQHPPIDPTVYDTTAVRYDWEQVSGMQDAARSGMVQAKTATEASIMQQSLSGRVSEFRDQVEDWLQEIAEYAAQVLLQELSEAQVQRIMGEHKMAPMMDQVTGEPVLDLTGEPIMIVAEPAYDWPQMSRDDVFDLVQIVIDAGSTGEPDQMEQQEVWIKLMPVVQPLILQIMQFQMQGVDTSALETLLKETVSRFDDKLEIDTIMPKLQPAMQPPMQPTQ